MTPRPTRPRRSPDLADRRASLTGHLRSLLVAVVIAAVALVAGVVLPGTVSAATGDGSGLVVSPLAVKEQTLVFELTNTTTQPITPRVTILGTAVDGSAISYIDRAIDPVSPGVNFATRVPLAKAPKALQVNITTSTGSVQATWPVAGIPAAVLAPGATPPPPPDPGSSTASIIVFTLVGLFLLLLLWWAVARHNRRKRRLQERAALIAGAGLAERQGEAAAAAAVAAAGIPKPLVVPPPLQPGQPFPPPAGAPVEAITLDLVAAGAVLIGPTPARPVAPIADPQPEMAMAGAPFPPPAPDAMVPTDTAATAVEPPSAAEAPVQPGTPFPPPNGAPVG